MELIISGRHVQVDDDIRNYTREKVQRLENEYPKLTTARVVLDRERSWSVAEVHVSGKHLSLDAKAKTRDLLIAIDSAVDKLEKQLRKHLERMQDHRVRKDWRPVAPSDDEDAAAAQ